MPNFNQVMIDLETTGTSPDTTAIIQIAAVKFDLHSGQIDHNFFNRCLLIPPTRFWQESTRDWWLKQPREILHGIYDKMEEPATVMEAFYHWADGPQCDLHLWGKPLSFEFPFIQSYFREFGPSMPFDFRKGRDLRTFLTGLNFPDPPMNDREVPFEGTAHDALFDTLHQIKILFTALQQRTRLACEVLPPS